MAALMCFLVGFAILTFIHWQEMSRIPPPSWLPDSGNERITIVEITDRLTALLKRLRKDIVEIRDHSDRSTEVDRELRLSFLSMAEFIESIPTSFRPTDYLDVALENLERNNPSDTARQPFSDPARNEVFRKASPVESVFREVVLIGMEIGGEPPPRFIKRFLLDGLQASLAEKKSNCDDAEL